MVLGRRAVLSTVHAAEIAGIRALLVQAYGFTSSPVDPLTVMIGLSEAENILSGERRRQIGRARTWPYTPR